MTCSAYSETLISRGLEIISHIYTVPSRMEAQTGRRVIPEHSQIVKSVIPKWWSWH